MYLVGIPTKYIFFALFLWTEKPKIGTIVTQSRYLARSKSRGSEPYQDPHQDHVQTAVAAPVGTGGPVLAAPAGVGCLVSGAPYKPRGPDEWRIPNLDRSTVLYRPNQTSTPSPPVGNKRSAVSEPDAGGVELQPRPLGTMSGGEGQAGTGLVSSHHGRK